jgi:hypothetical protein
VTWPLVLPTRRDPRVRIDRVLHDRGAVLLEQRTQSCWQQGDRAVHDEFVRFESPRVGGAGNEQRENHEE